MCDQNRERNVASGSSPYSLQHGLVRGCGMGQFIVCFGRRVITSDAGRKLKTGSVCIALTNTNGKEVCTNRQGSSRTLLGCQNVSAELGGSSVHTDHRSQKPEVYHGPWKSSTSYNSSTTATLVSLPWCICVSNIEYRGSKQHADCDGLPRLPFRQVPEDKPDEVEMFHMTVVETLPVTERELRRETHRHALVSRLAESGWEGVESQPNLLTSIARTN